MEIGIIREIDYKSININGVDYQAPAPVVRAIQKLQDEIRNERRENEKAAAKLKEDRDVFTRKVAKRIVYNLADGLEPIKKTGTKTSKVKDQNYKEIRCLAYDINDFEVNSSGQTVFGFSDEVYRRIVQAINGYKKDGNRFKE